jgi:hypothetical protein
LVSGSGELGEEAKAGFGDETVAAEVRDAGSDGGWEFGVNENAANCTDGGEERSEWGLAV